MKQYSRAIRLSHKQQQIVKSILHPHMFRLYQMRQAVFVTVKQGGMGALLKKVTQKVSRIAGAGV